MMIFTMKTEQFLSLHWKSIHPELLAVQKIHKDCVSRSYEETRWLWWMVQFRLLFTCKFWSANISSA